MKSLNDIDRTTKEGRLLFAALAKITTESQTDKTPEEVLEQLSALADEIEEASVEHTYKENAFNPTFLEIEEAYKKGTKVKTDTNKEGVYRSYQIASCQSDFGQQVDGLFGGSEFVSSDGVVKAIVPVAIRGFNVPSTLFKTKDDVVLLFY